MKRRMNKIVVIFLATTMLLGLVACKRPDPIEIDRTFEYNSTEEVHTQPSSEIEATSEKQSETESETEHLTEPSGQETTEPTKEVETTQMSAESIFGDPKNVFSTLPLFDKGEFVEYFEKDYISGVRFVNTKKSDLDEYVNLIVEDKIYKVNSIDGDRVYLEDSKNMCVTVIYHEGITLIEAGRGYWDILTYAEEKKEEPTKPSETTDGRYIYFDDKNNIFSNLPYFTEGVFDGYLSAAGTYKMTFLQVTDEVCETYLGLLENSGFDCEFAFGNPKIYGSDTVFAKIYFSDNVLTIEAGAK